MSTNLYDFIKSAAEYTKETGDVVSLAYNIVNDVTTAREKCAAFVPATVAKLESLDRANGTPFIPDGFSKQAAAILSDHGQTLALLNNVLGEYEQLKSAVEKLTPSIGGLGTTKTGSVKTSDLRNGNVFADTYESAAWQRGRERLLNI